jgi:hypothetical protein
MNHSLFSNLERISDQCSVLGAMPTLVVGMFSRKKTQHGHASVDHGTRYTQIRNALANSAETAMSDSIDINSIRVPYESCALILRTTELGFLKGIKSLEGIESQQ